MLPMMVKPKKKLLLLKFDRGVPLQLILIIPFALQIFGAVGLVWYFSFKHSQKSIQDLAGQLMVEIEDRIDEHLDTYLASPHQINQLNKKCSGFKAAKSTRLAGYGKAFLAAK